MFLNRFKKKSNLKFINKLLNSRSTSISSGKIKSVGVILNLDEFNKREKLLLLFKSIGLRENKVKFITFIADEKTAPNYWDLFFYPKNFGWNGKIKNIELEVFLKKEFDILISYYRKDNIELNMVTALSKANFKVGITNKDQRLNDFIIDVEPNQFNVFKEEFVKYLKVLNKI